MQRRGLIETLLQITFEEMMEADENFVSEQYLN